MGELLKNALLGWQAYITPGKLPVLLAVELLFCWLTGRKLGQKALVCYMGAMACVCVFPVTAVLLMVYQTKFYDYQWIWSTVPLTVVTAYGAVEILGSISEPWKRENLKKSIPGVFVLLAILFLCSGFGQEPVNPGEEIRERNRAEKVLAELPAEKGILLWAPADIMEYARAEDSSVTLLYGRNMWDKWLDAYSYDTYPEAYEELYKWIENEEQFSRGKITEEDFQERKRAAGQNLTLTEAVERAAAAGVNCILLPESLDFEEISALAEKKGFEYKKLDGYHLLTL